MINSSDYKEISDDIADLFDTESGMISSLTSMESAMLDSDVFFRDSNRVDLLSRISEVYFLVASRYSTPEQTLEVDLVSALQRHILRSYSSVDEFLNDNGVKVKSAFAALSAAAGYSISSSNIE